MQQAAWRVYAHCHCKAMAETYQYGFLLKKDEVVEEWLYSKAKTARNKYRTIFYRKKSEEPEMNGVEPFASRKFPLSVI